MKEIKRLRIELNKNDENKVQGYRANNLECDLAMKINEIIDYIEVKGLVSRVKENPHHDFLLSHNQTEKLLGYIRDLEEENKVLREMFENKINSQEELEQGGNND